MELINKVNSKESFENFIKKKKEKRCVLFAYFSADTIVYKKHETVSYK